VLVSSIKVGPGKAADGTIYIRVDGSIEPTSANITSTDNVTYYFTGSNYDSIVVQRDNILIDGMSYSVLGTGSANGILLGQRTNVTIKNTQISGFTYGIRLPQSRNCTVSNTNCSGNDYGMYLGSSVFNLLEHNKVTKSRFAGICLTDSSHNILADNNVSDNRDDGIVIYDSIDNEIVDNECTFNSVGIFLFNWSFFNIVANNNCSYNGDGMQVYGNSRNNTVLSNILFGNGIGIDIAGSNWSIFIGNEISSSIIYGVILRDSSSQNIFFHNSLVNTTHLAQVWDNSSYGNVWDDGYPSGGNYWSDYSGTDANWDGIGDTPCIVDTSNQDNYPLMIPWGSILGDVNGDGYVGIDDIFLVASHFGKELGDPDYFRIYDLNGDGYIGVDDIFTAAKHFGEETP
jgi:parallel beta-helix repeat protein